MSDDSKIFVGSDHAGFLLKKQLVEQLRLEFPALHFEDLGCVDETSVDYPDLAEKVGRKVVAEKGRGLLVCGSGIGMCIAANKVKGVRAASSWDATSARLSRQHNDANVVCLGSRLTGSEVALEIVKTWLTTTFLGGRHQKRVERIRSIEEGK